MLSHVLAGTARITLQVLILTERNAAAFIKVLSRNCVLINCKINFGIDAWKNVNKQKSKHDRLLPKGWFFACFCVCVCVCCSLLLYFAKCCMFLASKLGLDVSVSQMLFFMFADFFCQGFWVISYPNNFSTSVDLIFLGSRFFLRWSSYL